MGADTESSRETTSVRSAWRILRVGSALFSVHLEVAQREVSRDASRLVTGGVFLGLAATFVAMLALALNVLGALAFVEHAQLSWLWSVLCVAGIDLTLALGFALIGRGMLRRPVLSETRGLVRRTVSALRA